MKSDDEDFKLAKDIRSSNSENIVSTTLRTDERVIARVTDGIYRQPGSSIRELISNAYDADATRVVIKTDAPRFERIVIEDNGHGMSPEALAHLLKHIGGSAKRNEKGAKLGVTASHSSLFSPNGRRLIGKIGIGLFSVSQLTHKFQIITKVAGDSYRTVAAVTLRQYADDSDIRDSDEDETFESGKVNIWRESATDKDSHGTTIVLNKIRKQARDTLRSREVWNAIDQNEDQVDNEEKQEIQPPRFHIGRVDETGDLMKGELGDEVALPWSDNDDPDRAFENMVQSVWDESTKSTPNPQLDRLFDYYLRMIWQISLSIPLPYVDGHVFDQKIAGWAEAFLVSNKQKGSAEQVSCGKATLRQKLDLEDPNQDIGDFEVFFDQLRLSRPLKFKYLPVANGALKHPLIFVGKCREEFEKVPRELSGGPLEFEAYLFWNPKIAPVEHQGALIRIHGSSGTLFDSSFMRYQVSEQTRLRQITCEIFVKEGLDSAINIDRESFNSAHPHTVYITKWLHNSLRQVATTQKRISSEIRNKSRDQDKGKVLNNIQSVASRVWEKASDDVGSAPPSFEFTDSGESSSKTGDVYAFKKELVIPPLRRINTKKIRNRRVVIEEQVKAIAQVLASYGVFETTSKSQQQSMLKAIFEILEVSGE